MKPLATKKSHRDSNTGLTAVVDPNADNMAACELTRGDTGVELTCTCLANAYLLNEFGGNHFWTCVEQAVLHMALTCILVYILVK